jgi:hypothetical protein
MKTRRRSHTFVVTLLSSTRHTAIRGRVRHIASGAEATITSAEALLSFFQTHTRPGHHSSAQLEEANPVSVDKNIGSHQSTHRRHSIK